MVKDKLELASEEETQELLKQLFTKRYLNKIDANEDDIIAEPSFDMYDVRRLIFIAQQEAKCSGYEPYEKIARADEKAKILQEILKFMDNVNKVYHTTPTELKIRRYLEAELKETK